MGLILSLPCKAYGKITGTDGDCFSPKQYSDVKKGIFSIILTATILTIFEISLFYGIITPQVNNQMDKNLENVADKLSAIYLEKITDTKTKQEQNYKQYEKEFDIEKLKYNIDEQKKDYVANLIYSSEEKDKTSKIIDNILKTTSDREENLTRQINGYTLITSAVLILLLFYILYLIWGSIFSDQKMELLKIKSDLNRNLNSEELDKINKTEKSLDSFFYRFCVMADPTILALITVVILISFQYSFYLFGQTYKYPGGGRLSDKNINIFNKYRSADYEEYILDQELPIKNDDIRYFYGTNNAEKIEKIKKNNNIARNDIKIVSKYFKENPDNIDKYIESTGQEELIIEIVDQIHIPPLVNNSD